MEPGLYPAIGRAPHAIERLTNVLALVLAYAVFLVAAALALGSFYIGRPCASLVAIAAGGIALWLFLVGEHALDAQALEEVESQVANVSPFTATASEIRVSHGSQF